MTLQEIFPGETARLIPLLEEEGLTDILINGTRDLYVEKEGVLFRRPPLFESLDPLESLIERILICLGKRIDARHPFADGVLPDGSRFHILLPPLVKEGAHISIRRLSHAGKFPLSEFANEKTGDLLRKLISHRESFLIAGGTGSGKTTLASALLDEIPGHERVITLEETQELRTRHPHAVHLIARPPSVEGEGEVTLRMLIRNALRMRPDRILLGECRGDEAIDLMQALNTGHPGSFCTLHANGALDALRRLETLVMLSGYFPEMTALRQYIASAVRWVVFLRRVGMQRKIAEIVRVCGTEGNQYRFEPVLE